jgi:hypothetical protein
MSALLQEGASASKRGAALERLNAYIEELRQRKKPIGSLEEFEREAHELVVEVEQEVVAEGLSRFDIDALVVDVDGQRYRQVYRGERAYLSAAGPVRVARSLYRAKGGGKTICPLEMQAGIVDGYWTPLAARQGVWVTAQLPPAEGEALFRELGNMAPSKSSLDRLSRELGEGWEAHREGFEASLCEAITVPLGAVSVSASLDGVMVPMKRPPGQGPSDTWAERERQGKDRAEAAAGKSDGVKAQDADEEDSPKKPCYKEASCATLSFYDAAGERLDTLRFARMPEPGKKTLKSQLSEAVAAVLGQRPELQLVKLADGAKDNWRFLADELRPGEGVELIDFFHASDHLSDALQIAYGKGSTKAKAQHKKYRAILRDEPGGVETVIRTLDYLKKKHPRREKLATELSYFRSNRHRMQYATARANHLPIGSGVTEAACKTLVTQRLKCSGMRWKTKGGQGVLTMRGLIQSGRFDSGWQLLSRTYRQAVSMPDNVVPLNARSR